MTRRDPQTLDEARQVLGLSVPAAAKQVGVSTSAMYLAVERGEVASTRLCGRILVQALPLCRQFGLGVDDKELADAASHLKSTSAHQSKFCQRQSK